MSKYKNCSSPGMCENTSLIECVLPLWQTVQERSNSCAELGYDWQSLSDPSEITSCVGEVSMEINTIANVQWLKIGFSFTFSLSSCILHLFSQAPYFPHFISSICVKDELTALNGTPVLLFEKLEWVFLLCETHPAVADCTVSPLFVGSAKASCKITKPSDPSVLCVIWQSLPWLELLSLLLFFFPSSSTFL